MDITSLIEKLQQLKDQYGNILVECRDLGGDFNLLETVDIVNTATQHKTTNWRVFLDT